MSKTLTVGIVVVIAIVVVAFFFLSSFINPFNMNSQNQQPITATTTPAGSATGLVVQDEVVGTGATTAQLGDVLTVNYTGKLQNGTIFDTSIGKAPIQFTLGAGQVIPGWDQGLQGMRVGGTRLLIIPPGLAYGSQGVGSIPPNSTLVFEVQLLGVQAPSPAASTSGSPTAQ